MGTVARTAARSSSSVNRLIALAWALLPRARHSAYAVSSSSRSCTGLADVASAVKVRSMTWTPTTVRENAGRVMVEPVAASASCSCSERVVISTDSCS